MTDDFAMLTHSSLRAVLRSSLPLVITALAAMVTSRATARLLYRLSLRDAPSK